MTDSVKAVGQQTAAAVKKPVNTWRRTISEAGAIVAKPWRRYRASIFQGYLIGAIAAFLVLAVLAKTVAYFAFDVTITRTLQTSNAAWFDTLMRTLTWIGFGPQADLITLAILVFLYASGLKWETVVAFVSVVGSTTMGLGIKVLVDRPRPSADLVNIIGQLKDYSFPIYVVSGVHAAQAFMVAHRAPSHLGGHGSTDRPVAHLCRAALGQ